MKSNIQQLTIAKFSRDATSDCDRTEGGVLQNVVDIFQNPDRLRNGMAAAREWVMQAISVMRTASCGTYRDATDEEIAGVIMDAVRAREAMTAISRGKVQIPPA